jgi:dodecin
MAVAKVIEIISGSKVSFDDAVKVGVARAAETVSDVSSAWVKDQSVNVVNGKVVEYRVVMKVTFLLKPPAKAAAKPRKSSSKKK